LKDISSYKSGLRLIQLPNVKVKEKWKPGTYFQKLDIKNLKYQPKDTKQSKFSDSKIGQELHAVS